MAFHRKFTFDDPEDSYWNENGSSSSSFFDDVASKQETARAALEDLFESVDPQLLTPRNPEPPVPIERERANTEPPEALQSESCSPRKGLNGSDRLPPRTNALNKFVGSPRTQGLSKETSAVSIAASECSASSLPSEAQQLDLDYSRLRAEHRKLQRHLETIRAERYRAPNVRETIGRLIKGETVSLDLYRSKQEKLDLLKEAIDAVDGEIILTVILFLKNTLSDTLFREILLEYREAADEYIAYLKEIREVDELTSTLFALGRNSDAAIIEYTAALRLKTTQQKLNGLKKCLTSAFSDPTLQWEQGVIGRHVNLLNTQMAVEAVDKEDRSGKIKLPDRVVLTGQPPIHTLYYLCLYHFDSQPPSASSPQALRHQCAFSEKLFVWTAVSALVAQFRWPDVEKLLLPKSIIGSLTSRVGGQPLAPNCPVSIENVMFVLHENEVQPPKDLLCRLLRNVNDADQRLQLAEKYFATEIVLEILSQQKDRHRLQIYSSKLTPNSPDYYKAMAMINNSRIKWKN